MLLVMWGRAVMIMVFCTLVRLGFCHAWIASVSIHLLLWAGLGVSLQALNVSLVRVTPLGRGQHSDLLGGSLGVVSLCNFIWAGLGVGLSAGGFSLVSLSLWQ